MVFYRRLVCRDGKGRKMKHYINYDEVLSYLDEEISKGAFPADVDVERLLINNFKDSHIFTVLHNATLLFQRESLLSHHRRYSQDQHAMNGHHVGAVDRSDTYLDHFISTLGLKYYDDGSPGIPIVEDIICDYIFEYPEFKRSLKKEGVYGILNCTCQEIYCGGLFLEVKHIGEEMVGWTMAYYQERYPRSYLRGLLFDEGAYYDYLSKPEKMQHWRKSDEINRMRRRAKEVWVRLPLFFHRQQLEQL
jgi:hypothetical protein